MQPKNLGTIVICISLIIYTLLSQRSYVYENFQSEPKRVAIIGCARNVGQYLEKTIQKLIELKQIFHPDSKIIVAENDSTDNTKDILKAYSEHITTLSYDGKITMPTRTERLAYLRNELMKYVHEKYPLYDYVINADLDLITHSLDVPKTKQILQSWENKPWDALFANSHPYYDIWALRSKYFGCEVDCWDAMEHDTTKNFNHNIGQFMKTIPANNEPILVDSAFNGLGIYRLSSTKGCVYDGVTRNCSLGYKDTLKCNKERCEHVAFHDDMRRNGKDKLFIVPGLLVQNQY